jgi:HK97 family phage major capsid protein
MSKAIVYSGVRPLNEITTESSELLAKSQKILATAKAEGRDLNSQEIGQVDSIHAELQILSVEKSKAEEAAKAEAFFNSPAVAGLLPGSVAGGTGSGLRSRSGKPIAKAVGPKQRLGNGSVGGHFIGELARAAAIGVTAYTPAEVRAELRSDENSKGGYAVPDSWLVNWIDRAVEFTTVAQYCTRQVMNTESLNVTTIESRPTLQTKAQLDKFADTGIVFGNRRLEAFTAGGLMLASLEMLEDAPNAAEQVEVVSMRAIVDWLNDKMLNGSGSEEPLGVLRREDLPEDDTVGPITWDAIADGVTALRQEVYAPNACIVSPAVFNALHLQRENDDGDGLYLARPEHLRDLNIVASSHCPDDKLVLADFTQLMLGIREGAKVEVSPHGDAFDRNGVSIRLKLRVDWVPIHTSAFRILSGITLPE